MNQTPEQHLAILLSLLNRCSISELESIGANVCVESIRKALAELKDFKNPPAVKAAD